MLTSLNNTQERHCGDRFTSKMSKERLQFCFRFVAVICIFPKKQKTNNLKQMFVTVVCIIFFITMRIIFVLCFVVCVGVCCVSLEFECACTHVYTYGWRSEQDIGYLLLSLYTLVLRENRSLTGKFKVSARLTGQKTLGISMSPPASECWVCRHAEACLDFCICAVGSNSLSRGYIASTLSPPFNYSFTYVSHCFYL